MSESNYCRYGGATVMGGAMVDAAAQFNLEDDTRDVLIVISDGFFGDLDNVQMSSAECCSLGISTMAIAYESNSAILVRNKIINVITCY